MRQPTIFEDPALRWFLTYALVCSLTAIALIFILLEVAPLTVDKPTEPAATGTLDEAEIVRPAEPGFARKLDEPDVVTRSTPPAVVNSPTAPSVVGPAEPELRGPFEPVVVRKSDRVGQ